MQPITVAYQDYIITTDKSKMNVHDVHKWLSEESYWNKNIPFDAVKTVFDNSFCIGILKDDAQIGFARLITDYAVLAYVVDVYITEEHRGKGLARKMLQILFDIDWVKKLRTIKLGTTDAHGLYEKFGFIKCDHPERIMEIKREYP